MRRILPIAALALLLGACGLAPPPPQAQAVRQAEEAVAAQNAPAAEAKPDYRQSPIERAQAVEPAVMENKERQDKAIEDSGG